MGSLKEDDDMIDFDEVFNALSRLPDYLMPNGFTPERSYPLLREVDGKLYLIYMVHYYDVSGWPDAFYVYDPESKTAFTFKTEEALWQLGMETFPAEPRFAINHGEREDVEDLFWDTIESGSIDREAYAKYLGTCVHLEPSCMNGYYWAFLE